MKTIPAQNSWKLDLPTHANSAKFCDKFRELRTIQEIGIKSPHSPLNIQWREQDGLLVYKSNTALLHYYAWMVIRSLLTTYLTNGLHFGRVSWILKTNLIHLRDWCLKISWFSFQKNRYISYDKNLSITCPTMGRIMDPAIVFITFTEIRLWKNSSISLKSIHP